MQREEKCLVQVLSAGHGMGPGWNQAPCGYPRVSVCIAVLDQQPSHDVSPAWGSHWQRFHSVGGPLFCCPYNTPSHTPFRYLAFPLSFMLQRLFLLCEALASPGLGRRSRYLELERRGLLNLVAEQEEPVPARPGAQSVVDRRTGSGNSLCTQLSPSHIPFHRCWVWPCLSFHPSRTQHGVDREA